MKKEKDGIRKHEAFVNGNEIALKGLSTKHIYGRERTRMLVRLRDNFTCQDCGLIRTPKQAKSQNKRLFDIHHLNRLCGKMSRGYDRVSDMHKLVTLCHGCHFNRHDHSQKLTKKLSGVGNKVINR